MSDYLAEEAQLNAEYDRLVEGRPSVPIRQQRTRNKRGDLELVDHADLLAWVKVKAEWEQTEDAIATAPRRKEIRARLEAIERLAQEEAKTAAYSAQSLARLERAGVPKLVIANLKDLQPTTPVNAARDWWRSDSWCLALVGTPGTGKSTAAGWLAQQATMLGHGRDWVVWLRATQASLASFGEETERRMEHARKCSLLVLEEVGSEFWSDAWRARLEDVLDFRYSEQLRTVITSNLSNEAFKEKLGLRLIDRLREGGKFVGTGKISMRGATP